MSASSEVARILTAIRPAFFAPPIETVATGTPAGICTIDSSESSPSRRDSGTGTPTTGSVVTDASMPGRCAAPPAPAMITLMPRSAAFLPNAIIFSGVRWAETTSTSWSTPNSSSTAEASCMTVQSESDPMTTATRGRRELTLGMASMLFGSPERTRCETRSAPTAPAAIIPSKNAAALRAW